MAPVTQEKRQKQLDTRRTLAQNNSLWLLFTRIAQNLNDAGFDLKKVVKTMREDGIEIQWTKDMIHDILWIPIQQTMFKTDSTTKLNRKEEIDLIYMTLTRFLGERLNVEMPAFPSIEELENKELSDEKG